MEKHLILVINIKIPLVLYRIDKDVEYLTLVVLKEILLYAGSSSLYKHQES